MKLGIHHNPAQVAGLNNFVRLQQAYAGSQQKLATGLAINAGRDNPAGLIASENLRSQIAAIEAEMGSLQRADAVAQTADGTLSQVGDALITARGLAVRAADSTLSGEERGALQMEMDAVMAGIDRLGGTSSFNGMKLFDGGVTLRAGGESLALPSLSAGTLAQAEVDGVSYTTADLKSGGAANLFSGSPTAAGALVDAAISRVATLRGQVGSLQKHTLDTAMNAGRVALENTFAAESQIRDTDYAKQTAETLRGRVLMQAQMSVLKTAGGVQRQSVLTLLG